MINAAGIMFLNTDGEVLLLQRGKNSDWAGAWCFPGGKIELGETPEQAAMRECVEEIGMLPEGERISWTRRIATDVSPMSIAAEDSPGTEPVDYTTFLQRVPARFTPTLNDEHAAWAWCKVSAPTDMLHPGTKISLMRFGMNETDVAKAIRDGELTSPQQLDNMTLFALRITGTGAAYRESLDEYAWRDPSIYLTDEFLARCNGLPIVWHHPEKGQLDSNFYAKRVVGAIMLSYIKDDEVWGIGRIQDDEAARLMAKSQLSTSPGVVGVGSQTLKMENGSDLLIEKDPKLLDHLAICEQGVWDKGGDPAGVGLPTTVETTSRGSSIMPEPEDKKEDRKDADVTTGSIDKVLEGVNKLCDRMDAMDKRIDSMAARKDDDDSKRKDADGESFKKWASEEAGEKEHKSDSEEDPDAEGSEEAKPKEIAADKAKRKDADGEESMLDKRKDSKRKDDDDDARKDAAARLDAALRVNEDMAKEIRRLSDSVARMPKTMADEDYTAMADSQARYDGVYSALGKRAPAPMQGETLDAYQVRLAKGVQEHSPQWKDVPLRSLPPAAFAIADAQIRADAVSAARSPTDMGAGELREIRRKDQAGREITEFVGDISSWMGDFRTAPRGLARPFFNRNPGQRSQ